jgi:3-phosphoshikimate 1-carboxyvinyltransferase
MAARPRPLRGTVTVPGDKSISHRALLLSGLASGPAVVSNVNLGADVLATCRFLCALGVGCEIDHANHVVQVYGRGWEGLREPDDVIDAANSGTTLRIGLGVLAGAPVAAVMTGDRSLRSRPMGRVVEPLRALGARIDGRHHGKHAPLWVRGGGLRGADVSIEVASAQVKSAVLLAGLRASGTTSVTEPGRSRDHTERMLGAAGIEVQRAGETVAVAGGQELVACDRRVPGDLSSAMYLVVAASLIEGSDLTVADVGLNPTRVAGLEALAAMGADVRFEHLEDLGGEPVGRVRARTSELLATDVSAEVVPRLVDEVPALAVAATQARGETHIRGAGELRVKESDRIEALAAGLQALGAAVEARPDGLVIRGPTPLRGGHVDARGDHRIALALAVAGLVSGAAVDIEGWECTRVSVPGWSDVVAAAQGRNEGGGA